MTRPVLDCAPQFIVDGPDLFVWAFIGVLAAHAAWDLAWGVVYGIFRGMRRIVARIRACRRHRAQCAWPARSGGRLIG